MSYPKDNSYYHSQYPDVYPGYCEDGMVNRAGHGADDPIEKKPSWNWGTHFCSAFTMLCCCWCICVSSIFGLCGLVCSIGSYTDYKSGDYKSYKYKKSCAVGCLITGMVLGAGTLAAGGYFGYTMLYPLILPLINELMDTINKIASAPTP